MWRTERMSTMSRVRGVVVMVFLCLWCVHMTMAQDTGRDVTVIQSDQGGNHLLANMGTIRLDYGVKPVPTAQDSIALDANARYQKIVGFGAAFTESAAYTFSQTNAQNQQAILDAYWGTNPNTSNYYTVARLVIGSCDYSLNFHSYDDTPNDNNLSNFSIAYDEKIIIPFIQRAYKQSGSNIKFVASPWSPPAWMKTNNNLLGGGNLKTSNYQTMANYMSKYIDAMKSVGLPIWGVTPQNEPEYGPSGYPGCVYDPQSEANYIKSALGPTLAKNHPEVNILGFDHNRDNIYKWAQTFYGDPEVAKYLWGIGFHWYATQPYFQNVQDTHDLAPNKGLMLTEAAECNTGQQDWQKGEQFAYDIINDLNVWAQGFIQWNVILQDNGQGRWGPFEGVNGVNTCQSPIVTLNGQVVKKPSYYYIGHFSRYLPPGSVRIGATYKFSSQNLYATAFMNPKSQIVLIIANLNNWIIDLNVTDYGRIMAPKVPANGILTLIYQSWSNYS